MSTVQFFKGTSSKVTSATKQANSFYNDTTNNILYFCDNIKTLHRLNSDTAAKTTSLSWGTTSTIATIDGNTIQVKMPNKPVIGIIAGNSNTTSNDNASNPYIKIKDDNKHRSQIQLVGDEGIYVESNANGQVRISTFFNNMSSGEIGKFFLIGQREGDEFAERYDINTYIDAETRTLYNKNLPVVTPETVNFQSFYQGTATAGLYYLEIRTLDRLRQPICASSTYFYLSSSLANYKGNTYVKSEIRTSNSLIVNATQTQQSYPLVITNQGDSLFNISIGSFVYNFASDTFYDSENDNWSAFDYRLIKLNI